MSGTRRAGALVADLTIAAAREAARRGDLDGASRLVAGVPEDPEALDLRARIHAQRGELERADACWARAQELAPGDEGAAAGRAAIAEVRAGRRRLRPSPGLGWALVAAAGLGGAALVWWAIGRRRRAQQGRE